MDTENYIRQVLLVRGGLRSIFLFFYYYYYLKGNERRRVFTIGPITN